jgi:hypothetical protein
MKEKIIAKINSSTTSYILRQIVGEIFALDETKYAAERKELWNLILQKAHKMKYVWYKDTRLFEHRPTPRPATEDDLDQIEYKFVKLIGRATTEEDLFGVYAGLAALDDPKQSEMRKKLWDLAVKRAVTLGLIWSEERSRFLPISEESK